MPIIFIIASLVTLIAAVKVVTGRSVFHNALFLVLSFVGVAAPVTAHPGTCPPAA